MDAEGLPVDMATVFNETNDILVIGYLVPERTEIYSYDDKGNRLQETVRQINEKQTDYEYYEFSDRLRVRGDIAYEYDNVGNLIRKGSSFVFENNTPIFDETGEVYVEYEYDLFNRLLAVKKYNSDTASIETRVRYTYDAQNLRIERNHVEDGIEQFFYDLSGVLIERYSGATTRTEILLFGRHFARIEDDSTESITLFYHLDHLGSTTALSDINGEVIWSDEITPFGLSSGESGERTEAGLYTGKDLDEETGFYYFNARWYSAELGRFITEDPIRDGMNWYVYVSGNPMMFVDPTGLIDGPVGFGALWVGNTSDPYDWQYEQWDSWLEGEGRNPAPPDNSFEAKEEKNILPPPSVLEQRQANSSASARFEPKMQTYEPIYCFGWNLTNQYDLLPYAQNVYTGTHPWVDTFFAGLLSVYNLPAYFVNGVTNTGMSGLSYAGAGIGYVDEKIMYENMGFGLQEISMALYQVEMSMGGPGALGLLAENIAIYSRANYYLWTQGTKLTFIDDVASNWKFGEFKSATKWQNQMTKRGWTPEQITEALKSNEVYQMVNQVNPGNQALRYVHPSTGKSVVIDSVTKEILQVGGEGFVW
jgi:RHS repeat-associated protein